MHADDACECSFEAAALPRQCHSDVTCAHTRGTCQPVIATRNECDELVHHLREGSNYFSCRTCRDNARTQIAYTDINATATRPTRRRGCYGHREAFSTGGQGRNPKKT
jgi:hypothetical protein